MNLVSLIGVEYVVTYINSVLCISSFNMTRKKKQQPKGKGKSKEQRKTGTKDEDHTQQDTLGCPSQVTPEEGELPKGEIIGATENRPKIPEMCDGDQPEENKDESEQDQRRRRQESK